MKRAPIRVATCVAAMLAALPARAADHPLRIEEAVQLALTRNESAHIADDQVVVADAAVEKARTAFFPILTATATDTARPYSIPGKLPDNIRTGGATLSQPLLNASAWPLLRQAERLLDAQKATSTDEKRLLAFSAASAFFQTLSSEEVLEAAKRSVDLASANLVSTQERVEAQLNSSNDVTRAQLDLANSQQQVATDQGAVQRAYLALAFVINAPVEGTVAQPDAQLKAAAGAVPKVDDLIALAWRRRPDLLAARHSARAAHLFADEPLMRLIPTIGLLGTVAGNSNANPVFDDFLAGTVTWTIFDAGVRYADKHSRDATADIADLQYGLLVRSVANDVKDAVATLVAAQNALKSAGDAVTASRKSVEETSTLYRQGLTTALALTLTNDARFSAEVTYVSAELATALAYLALRQGMGLDPLGTELR